MKNDVQYVMPARWLYKFIDHMVEEGQLIQRGILNGIIQDLDQRHYRDVLRAIIKAIYSSGDEVTADRLSRTIVRGFDYLHVQKRHEADMQAYPNQKGEGNDGNKESNEADK
jgi:hypothetical protein